jgi:hypothetical protein
MQRQQSIDFLFFKTTRDERRVHEMWYETWQRAWRIREASDRAEEKQYGAWLKAESLARRPAVSFESAAPEKTVVRKI